MGRGDDGLPVIPGRRVSGEPGIQNGGECRTIVWIPGSRFQRAPE
jgi:hypothetical protein